MFTPPAFDHGVDIIGDEWEDLEDEEPAMSSNMEMEKRHDPVHPYCTNWPVTKKKEKNENI